MYAQFLGVGTVWLAATIDRPAFERAMEVGEGEVMPAVTPLGYAAPKKSVRESLMKKTLKADRRLPYEIIVGKTQDVFGPKIYGTILQDTQEKVDAIGKSRDITELADRYRDLPVRSRKN